MISKQLDGTNILADFTYNTSLDIKIENINNKQNMIIDIHIIYRPVLYFQTG